ncbi:Ig-like domain-containing protein [Streptomyces sulphureus]|uniref:L,D-transpeptidase n=1 Tax=Streptomyces sulphureus TaxID=47758 RepID=UPI00036644E2
MDFTAGPGRPRHGWMALHIRSALARTTGRGAPERGRSPARSPRRRRALRRGLFATTAGALCALAAGCGLLGAAPDPAEESIRVTPRDGARVRTGERVEVSVSRGRLDSVRVVRASDGLAVPGRIGGHGRRWRPLRADEAQGAAWGRKSARSFDGALQPRARYRVYAVARGADGSRHTRATSFTTRPRDKRFLAHFFPEDGQTVGTGTIVSLRFDRPITDRAAVERAVSVGSRQQEAQPHWFGRTRLDFRPRTYWRPGSRITLDLGLRGVRGGPSLYGEQRKSVHFSVGRDQRSTVDVRTHRMTVLRDGRPHADYPITAGAKDTPTYNGRMVVSERHRTTRMNGSTVGFGGQYDIEDVPHALRLSESGTFLHGNYWAKNGVFGSRNTSHGCIGLRDGRKGDAQSPAGAFWESTLVGDVVEVVGSPERTLAPDNGLGGWNLSWQEWREGSALG